MTKKINLSKNMLLNMYTIMEKIRQFEEKSMDLFMNGELPGFLHSYIGEEACATGVCQLLNEDDYITTTHRGHGHVIAKGADINRMMAELFAKKTGYCKGKGGSMHIIDRTLGILGANGIVGGGIPIATGAALSAQLKKTNQIAVCFFGDGASNEGSFHESVNMASIWKLPIVYVCENNQYAESVHHTKHKNVKDVADRATGYGIFSDIADGNDVLDVYEKMEKAEKRARNGEGPTLLELKTYRIYGHYVGDPAIYRPKDEPKEWRKEKDPIRMFREKLIQSKIVKEEELNEVKENITKKVQESVEFAKNSEDPDLCVALEDVFGD